MLKHAPSPCSFQCCLFTEYLQHGSCPGLGYFNSSKSGPSAALLPFSDGPSPSGPTHLIKLLLVSPSIHSWSSVFLQIPTGYFQLCLFSDEVDHFVFFFVLPTQMQRPWSLVLLQDCLPSLCLALGWHYHQWGGIQHFWDLLCSLHPTSKILWRQKLNLSQCYHILRILGL